MYETTFEIPGESFESYENEGESYESESYESQGEGESFEGEAELVQELMEISSEAEMDRFLGKLAGSIVRGAGKFIKSPVGKALGGVLKNVAKRALPVVGGALGSMVMPGAGTAIGAKLGGLAGGLLEAEEAESMGEVEAEYEAATRYVRFARAAYGNAARAPRNLPPRAIVRAASISAARRYAPSLLHGDQRRGQWRGRRRGYPMWAAYEPQPWYGGNGYDPGDGDDGYDDGYEGEGAGGRSSGGGNGNRAAEGRWVRRKGRIVVLGA
ncbi:hypothetical protein Ade02nite_14130 [Paractinoplanes deccanensis]|uniref:Uncharacterized protein n=1 Tax=Paractinoplanes deccanensis TaxID=113561 RepID=A0ABQ3XYN6_9ACTN|nr:hypothetical protein [Actinoplanes deccanensis]GID72772.1 hypothetical protein Ade02nite_14130 [Actinoplanes deccanensis]